MPVIVNTRFASLDRFNGAIRGGEGKGDQPEDRSNANRPSAAEESDDGGGGGIALRSLRNA